MNTLHQDDVPALFTLMKDTRDKRMYQRYQAVYLYLQDYSAEKIAINIGRSEKTVYNYVNSYKQHGIEGLKPGKAPGASYKLIPQQREELVQIIVNQLPADVIANVFYSSVAEIRKNVQSFLTGVNQMLDVVIDRLCIKM